MSSNQRNLEPLEFSYRMEAGDFTEAAVAIFPAMRWIGVVLVVFLGILAFTAFLGRTDPAKLMLAVGGYGGFYVVLFHLFPRYSVWKLPAEEREYRVNVSAVGVSIAGRKTRHELAWGAIARLRRMRHGYVLHLTNRGLHYIPARALTTEQRAALIAWMTHAAISVE